MPFTRRSRILYHRRFCAFTVWHAKKLINEICWVEDSKRLKAMSAVAGLTWNDGWGLLSFNQCDWCNFLWLDKCWTETKWANQIMKILFRHFSTDRDSHIQSTPAACTKNTGDPCLLARRFHPFYSLESPTGGARGRQPPAPLASLRQSQRQERCATGAKGKGRNWKEKIHLFLIKKWWNLFCFCLPFIHFITLHSIVLPPNENAARAPLAS